VAFILPDRYFELIILYIRWAAFHELAATESSDPYASLLAHPPAWQLAR
jgi:hypothetical protein